MEMPKRLRKGSGLSSPRKVQFSNKTIDLNDEISNLEATTDSFTCSSEYDLDPDDLYSGWQNTGSSSGPVQTNITRQPIQHLSPPTTRRRSSSPEVVNSKQVATYGALIRRGAFIKHDNEGSEYLSTSSPTITTKKISKTSPEYKMYRTLQRRQERKEARLQPSPLKEKEEYDDVVTELEEEVIDDCKGSLLQPLVLPPQVSLYSRFPEIGDILKNSSKQKSSPKNDTYVDCPPEKSPRNRSKDKHAVEKQPRTSPKKKPPEKENSTKFTSKSHGFLHEMASRKKKITRTRSHSEKYVKRDEPYPKSNKILKTSSSGSLSPEKEKPKKKRSKSFEKFSPKSLKDKKHSRKKRPRSHSDKSTKIKIKILPSPFTSYSSDGIQKRKSRKSLKRLNLWDLKGKISSQSLPTLPHHWEGSNEVEEIQTALATRSPRLHSESKLAWFFGRRTESIPVTPPQDSPRKKERKPKKARSYYFKNEKEKKQLFDKMNEKVLRANKLNPDSNHATELLKLSWFFGRRTTSIPLRDVARRKSLENCSVEEIISCGASDTEACESVEKNEKVDACIETERDTKGKEKIGDDDTVEIQLRSVDESDDGTDWEWETEDILRGMMSECFDQQADDENIWIM